MSDRPGLRPRHRLIGMAVGGLIAVAFGAWGHFSGDHTDSFGILEWLFPAWGPPGAK